MTISTFPRLSIITVTRNARTALLRTARSIAPLAARLDLEWIVVDGASGDGTRMWLESRDEPWLRGTSEADAGLYDAMNKGIDRARGQFLWFVNAGDEVADAAALAAIIDTCPPDLADRVLFADCLERETDGSLLLKTARDPAWLTYGLFAHHQGMLFGRDAIAGWRNMMGATDPAASAMGTIRGDFATLLGENVVHGSDSPESAAREIALFFPQLAV